MTSLVFIDSRIQDYQYLAANVTPDTEVVILDATQDGVDQITQALAGRSNLKSIQIVSHGSNGNVQLGNTSLNASTLGDYSAKIQSWGNALEENGDILFYGCNLAADEVGLQLIQQISQLTGADVAASEDLTGSSALGGDWDLEVQTGEIEASLAISEAAQDNYAHTLAIPEIAVYSTNSPASKVYRADLIGSSGTGDGQFLDPRAIAVDSQGRIYVGDSHRSDIQVFDKNGNFIRKFGSQGTGDGQFLAPSNMFIAVDSNDNIYAVDQEADRVQVFDKDGKFLRKFGSSGTGDGQFVNIIGMGIDQQNNVYVLDNTRKDVQVFKSSGNFLRKFGSPGTENGQFERPVSIALDPKNNVYVTQHYSINVFGSSVQEFSDVQIFNSNGTFIKKKIRK
ncbi:DUF4347 domain-containing protein [Dolichospermum sp. UHCC 0259]|uniref:DUF4347 domain-containing protein n=1 Tax=Dolichospermum sp. UHCC 0259 TaxID=2590010 RepID=UPI0014454D35|nr:DUF4347 domain-containing protein [Dolichospermum sp. UHCC 0259]MTJ49860.1 DUF4347 domain-containing protein [Dolichospermum sp. UHCC 0259]